LITAKERFSIIAIVEIIRSSLALGMVILVLYFTGNRLRLYAVLIAGVSIVPPMVYYLYSRFRFPSLVNWKFQKQKRKYEDMLGYSGWIMFGAASNAGEIQGSALIINLFFGTVLNAAFGIANQVNNIVKMFSRSLNQAVIPQITMSYSGGKTDRTIQLVIYTAKYSFLMMLIPSLPILLETDFILKLWLKEVPDHTSIFIKLMIINALITTMNAGVPAAVHATGKIKWFQITTSLLSLLGLPVSFLLFKHGFPPHMILLVYTGIAIMVFFVVQVFVKQLIHFDLGLLYRKAYIKMILVVLSVLPLFLITPIFESNMARFIGITLISVPWLLAAIYLIGMEKNEREIIIKYVRKLTLGMPRRKD
jgi:Na+-driven multidrug efflux pump